MSVTRVEKDFDSLTLTLVADFDAPIERVWRLWAGRANRRAGISNLFTQPKEEPDGQDHLHPVHFARRCGRAR